MKTILTILFLVGSIANADFDLANNRNAVVCTADDNQSWVLNKTRTKLKYTVEGESLGALKIIAADSDGRTYATYTTEEGTLTLSNKRDTFKAAGENEAYGVTCE